MTGSSPRHRHEPVLGLGTDVALDDGLRARLAYHLATRLAFGPADRSALLEAAAGTIAPPALISLLRGIPDRVYADIDDVWLASRARAENAPDDRSDK